MTTGRFKEHTDEDYLAFDEGQLVMRRKLANLAMRVARDGQAEGDERADKALAYYAAQRRMLNEAIKTKRYGDGTPPEQVIGLRAIPLAGRSIGGARRRPKSKRRTKRQEA